MNITPEAIAEAVVAALASRGIHPGQWTRAYPGCPAGDALLVYRPYADESFKIMHTNPDYVCDDSDIAFMPFAAFINSIPQDMRP